MKRRLFRHYIDEKAEHFGPQQSTVAILILTARTDEMERLREAGLVVEHIRGIDGAATIARRFDAGAIIASGLEEAAVAILRRHSPRVVVVLSTANIHSPRDAAAVVGRMAA